jgi:hypothetical protein
MEMFFTSEGEGDGAEGTEEKALELGVLAPKVAP